MSEYGGEYPRSEVQHEPERLIDGPHAFWADEAQACGQPLCRYDPQLIAAGERGVVESGIVRLQLDVAAQAVLGTGDRHNDDEAADSVVEKVDGHDNGRPSKGRFVSDRPAEVNRVDLPAPDHASVSQSARSRR